MKRSSFWTLVCFGLAILAMGFAADFKDKHREGEALLYVLAALLVGAGFYFNNRGRKDRQDRNAGQN